MRLCAVNIRADEDLGLTSYCSADSASVLILDRFAHVKIKALEGRIDLFHYGLDRVVTGADDYKLAVLVKFVAYDAAYHLPSEDVNDEHYVAQEDNASRECTLNKKVFRRERDEGQDRREDKRLGYYVYILFSKKTRHLKDVSENEGRDDDDRDQVDISVEVHLRRGGIVITKHNIEARNVCQMYCHGKSEHKQYLKKVRDCKKLSVHNLLQSKF